MCVTRPLDSILAARGYTEQQRRRAVVGSCLATCVATIVTAGAGLLIGIGIDDGMCKQKECMGNDFKSNLATVLSVAGGVIGLVATPIFVCISCRVAACTMGKRNVVVHMQEDDREPLVHN